MMTWQEELPRIHYGSGTAIPEYDVIIPAFSSWIWEKTYSGPEPTGKGKV